MTMSTDETPPEGGRDFRAALKARWGAARDAVAKRWPDALKGPVALALAGALVVGFGGGFAVGKGGHFFGGGKPAGAESVKGEAWSLFGKPRGANAPRRGIPKPEGFAVWQTRVDSSGPDPLACIRMSQDLDPSKAYADFVLVSPDIGRQPSVRVKGDELCLGGVGFTDHRITLLKGLPAKGGETLEANADVDFTFGEKPPYVGFAGDGVILPREESDGVAIETINVQALAIEVWRVPDRNLVRKSISAPEPTGEGDWAGDYGEDSVGDDGRQVWKGTVQVTGGATGQKATTVFPLGAVLKDMKAGAFVIKARDASGGREAEDGDNNPAQARRWIVFTDMAMLAYDGSESLDVVVRSLKSAKTMSGVRVALVAADGESLAEAQSDADGRVRFLRPLLKGQGAERAKMVMAYGAQGDLAVLDLDRSPVDLSKQGVGGRTEGGVDGRSVAADIDGYLYADRGIYRPGETVHLTAMIRDRMAKAVNDRKGEIIVKRPSGVEFRRYPFSQANAGVALADIALPRSAPRGRWMAELHVEGIEDATGALSFSVEDFAPQRLAVTATGQEATPLGAGDTRKVDVSARFLYGAPGAGLQTQGEARLRADTDPFPAYKGFEWGDQGKPFEEKYLDLGSTVTDGEGRAILSVGTGDVGDTAQPLVASVTASVFEPGGRPVREGLDLKVRPKAVYYGVKVEQGEAGQGDPPVSLDLIAVNAAGQRIGATATYALVAERWDYDWFQQNGRWQWRRSSRDAIVAKAQVNIGAGQPAKITRRLGWGDYRLEVEGADGAKTVTRFSAGWGAPAREGEAPDVVRVTAGTKTYAQGDTVEITLKPPYAGEAQIAVATDRLIDLKTVSVGENGTTVRLKTSAAWGGGAYVMVSVIQPRDPVASPKPRRALGLVYVPIDPKGRKLTVDLGTPSKIDSKAPVEIPVKVSGMGLGQKARITIAAVDEGILRLTHQESPDPVKWYFGKRALTLNYRDDYGRLLDPNMGAPANVNFGGDEIGGEGLTTTPIKTVALWSGVVETDLDGKAVVKLPAADFNGELRIQAVAWTDTAVGSASKPLTVRQPVVADLNLPRFLAPGDQAYATLELHNVEGKPGAYTAEAFSVGGLKVAFKKVFQLILGQRIAEKIPFLAPDVTGVGKIGFKVSGPGFATQKDYPIQTRLGWGDIVRTTTEPQKPGEAFTPSYPLLAGLAAGDVTMQVSYSPIRGFDPSAIAVALQRYPYGCTEQLVSTAYPLLYAQTFSNDPKLKRTPAALAGAVGKLLDRQTLDGAFGLWRVGDGEADPWLGAYVVDFLLEAKAQGVAVPDAAIDKAVNAMRQVSRPEGWASVAYRMEYPGWWASNEDASKEATERMRRRASAYALYVMAKAGKGDLARLRWWHDVQMKDENQPIAKAYVAAGLARMGDNARARSAMRQAVGSLGYRDEMDWYQSTLRDTAVLTALAAESGMMDVARQMQGRLENSVKDPDALNTQEQAALLHAANALIKASGPISIQATGANPLPPAGGAPRWAVGKLADARFVNTGKGVLWRTVSVRGTPVTAPPATASGLSVGKRLLSMGGAAIDPATIRQGDRIIVLVSGRSMQERSVALVVDDALPAGFEIETTLGADDAQNGPFKFLGELTAADVQESRDDRFIAALDLEGNKPFALAYVARAVTPGSFFLPGAVAKDMYRPAVVARSDASRATIAPGQ
ncbi:alpha-2-macroglobulin family protein [Caulobacter vibrioides]|uniref:Alpha-2-macroglobulin family protein n=2 Tax=Pseudomonadota TaxID=1224 RepID=A0A290N2D1_CAUVI|nr:alpha-2-macroglobulin [Caulobacter vibrioides]ATC33783.1 alpha-2-macroglobulin family protein [Caulobacter vibrioides]